MVTIDLEEETLSQTEQKKRREEGGIEHDRVTL
jgi:hypothetical protein